MINIWGPKAWKLIHCTAQGYPDNPTEEDKHNFKSFYYRLPYILPCSMCKDHFIDELRNNPIEEHLSSRKNIKKWLYNLHNIVNKRLNKQVLSYKDADKIYRKKIYIDDINQFIIFIKKQVQCGELKLEDLNAMMFYLNKIMPTFSCYSGGVARHRYDIL